MKTKNSIRLPKSFSRWADEAEANDKGFSDRQVWRVDELLEGRWHLFYEFIDKHGLIFEQQGERYRLATVQSHQLLTN